MTLIQELFHFVKNSAVCSSLKNTQHDSISVNRSCKAFIRNDSQKRYADQAQAQITNGIEPENVAIDFTPKATALPVEVKNEIWQLKARLKFHLHIFRCMTHYHSFDSANDFFYNNFFFFFSFCNSLSQMREFKAEGIYYFLGARNLRKSVI